MVESGPDPRNVMLFTPVSVMPPLIVNVPEGIRMKVCAGASEIALFSEVVVTVPPLTVAQCAVTHCERESAIPGAPV